MVDIDPNEKEYSVKFKEKDKRQNQRDDKMEILRQAIGLRDTNNILDLVKEARRTKDSENKNNPNIAKDYQTVVDINLYEMPYVHIKLTAEQAAALRRNPDVRWVTETGIVHSVAEAYPWGATRVQAHEVNNATRHRGYGVKVAVIDTGVNYNHVDIKPNYHGGVSFVAGVTDPKDDDAAKEGYPVGVYHGTHCSGTIAAAINNADVVGVAPEAYLYAAKVLDKVGSGTNAAVMQGMVWADQNNMDIMSMSLGSPTKDQGQADAANVAFGHGIFIAAAAGNDSKRELFFPAADAGVWGVGATDATDTKAVFSNWGPVGFVDFVAPGVGIDSDRGDTNTGTHLLDGTSQATPHIAGIYALGLANYRFSPCDTNTFPPTQTKLIHIVGAMITSCDTLGQTQPGVSSEMYGFGMPQLTPMLNLLTGTQS